MTSANTQHNVRAILDEARLHDVTIFASGNLDEYALRDLIGNGAPIDGFGIGIATEYFVRRAISRLRLQTAGIRGDGRAASTLKGKATWPGCKQVYTQARRLLTGW